MAFGERLQEVRRRAGLTQEQFAAELKVSRQAVSKWESCRGYPEIEKILYICNRYQVSLDKLFSQEVPREAPVQDAPKAPLPEKTLKTALSAFFANLAPREKWLGIGAVAIAILVVLVLIVIVRNIYVVQQSKAYVVERLGAFHSVWGVGLHLKVPFIERVVKKVSLKEQVADFDPQPVITKDNVTMQIDTVIYFQITDPKLYTYGVEYPMNAIENLTATTLRNIIGELELDQSLTSRDTINAKMRAILDEATDPWGIKVNRVELKNILPPREIQNAMEKQMKAERERRESILQAEGEKASKILVAEGEKQSAILKADAAKQARIMAAEAEATSIMKVQQALADAMRMLNENAPNDQVIKLKSLEALQKMADGKATKIIIPSEIQGLAGLAASAKTLLESDPPQE